MCAAAKTAVAAAVALGFADTAEAVIYWTGAQSAAWNNTGNWKSGTGWIVFDDSHVANNQYYMEWSGNLTQFTYIDKNYKALQFRGGTEAAPFVMNGKGYTYNSSGDKNDDRAKFAIADSTGDSALWFYNGTLKTRTFVAGTDSYSAWLKIGNGTDTTWIENTVNDMTFTKGTFIVEAKATAKTANSFRAGMDGASAQVDIKGTLTAGSHVAVGGTGSCVMNVNGGTVTVGKQLFLADTADVTGEMNVNGDSTVTVGQTFGVAIYGTGTFNLNGGIVTVNTGYTTKLSKNSGADGTLNLNGGTLETARIENPGGSGRVVFNGGTLKANNAHSSGLIDASAPVSVGENGGTIDTGAFNITVPVAINAVENTAGTFTVTGGGSATFSEMGDIAGAFTVGDNTTLHWFDQDNAANTYTLAGLTLGEGSKIYLNSGDSFGTTPVTVNATSAKKAEIEIEFSGSPAAGTSYALFQATDGDLDKLTVTPKFGTLTLPNDVSVVNGMLTLTFTADNYTWNGTGTNWGDTGAWTVNSAAADWSDGNNAVFETANATAALAADVSAPEVRFTADATVSGSATLTAAKVDVASGVTGTISAPTADTLEKTGAGTLTLGASRTAQTTVTEGTLAMADGATVDASTLTLGTDAAKPVTFDYGGQTLTADPKTYLGAGMNVTLANGVFTYENDTVFNNTTFPSILTVASGATLQTDGRFNWTTGGEATINIAGGTAKSIVNNNNWIMHSSYQGRLNINVTNGGLLEFGGETYMLTCRNGNDIFESPELHMKVVDSTVSVKNGKSIRLGRDDSTKASATPELTLAATNSVFDIGYGIYIGNDKTGLATGGSYKTDFENCEIKAKQFRVYDDRPLNNARLNNSRIVFNADGDITTADGDAKWITVDADGLVLDTNGKSVSLNANLGGSGAVTKVGSGKLTVAASQTNQTATAALNVNEGVLALAGGITVARPLVFADGATLDVTGTSSASIASLTFPAEGSVTLTMNGGAFAKGLYKILEKSGIAVADVQGKLVPSVGELPYEWSVTGDALYLTVDNPPANFWTGLGGDLKMSTAANWAGGAVPAADSDLDFSGVPSGTTIDADADYAFGNVTMGANVVTFTGSLTATSFSDSSKVAVGANATVTFDGDLMFTGSGTKYVVYKVDAGGKFIVTGKVGLASGASCNLQAQDSPGTGIIVAGSLVNDSTDNWIYVAQDNNSTKQKWAIGAGGITGTCTSAGMWVFSNNKVNPEIQPNTDDFTVSLWTVLREKAKSFTYNTTGLDGLGHTITLDAGFSDKTAPLYVTGTGKVVVNHVTKSFGGKNAYSGPVTVTNSATLAINAEKQITTGAITMNSGTTLALPQTGTVEMGGSLTLAGGAKLSFALAGNADTTIAVTDLALPENGAVTVQFAEGSIFAPGRKYTLLTGANLSDANAFELAADIGGSLSVESGNLVYTAPNYFYIKIVSAGRFSLKEDSGDIVTVDIPDSWLSKTGCNAQSSASDIAKALASEGANGIPVWKSYCLGLEPQNSQSKVLCGLAASQPSEAGSFNLTANLNVPENLSGVTVTAYLDRQSGAGGWTQQASAEVSSGSPVFTASADPQNALSFFA